MTSLITDKDIDKICDMIINKNYRINLLAPRGCGKTILNLRIINRLLERGYFNQLNNR